MSTEDFFMRLIGMVVLAITGAYLGAQVGKFTNVSTDYYAATLAIIGAIVGLALTPFFTRRPLRALRSTLGRVPAQSQVAGLIGLVVGLIIAALLSFPLSLLPPPFGSLMPFAGVILFSYFGVAVFVMRQRDIFGLVSRRSSSVARVIIGSRKIGRPR